MLLLFYCHIKLLFILYWINTASALKNLWNSTYTDQLKHDLLFKYDKFARPAQHFNTTTVNMGLVIKHIEIDEDKSMMIVNAWSRLEWTDEKLKWVTTEYGGLNELQIADHEIWQPDIVLYNSAHANNIDHYGNTHCVVRYDGTVLWVPPAQLPVFCDLDMTWWPYDTQTCYLLFGSWTYSGQQINLTVKGDGEVEVDDDADEWEIVSAKSLRHEFVYSCCPEPYHRVDFIITVKRRSPSYHAILFTPVAMSIVLTLAVFWLTPAASEKFLLSGVTSIMISMYLIYFSHRLPAVSISTPVVVQFYSANLCLVCLSMVVSVITHHLSRKVRGRPVPWMIIKPLTGKLGSFLALPTTKNSFMAQSFIHKTGEEELQECSLVKGECSNISSNRNDSDWMIVAVALDRIMFFAYILIFLIIIIFCLI